MLIESDFNSQVALRLMLLRVRITFRFDLMQLPLQHFYRMLR